MKLYLLSQDDNNDYDTYDSCIVCADSKEDAITISPEGNTLFVENKQWTSWAFQKSSISCEEIGSANKEQERGVILASFNAG